MTTAQKLRAFRKLEMHGKNKTVPNALDDMHYRLIIDDKEYEYLESEYKSVDVDDYYGAELGWIDSMIQKLFNEELSKKNLPPQ